MAEYSPNIIRVAVPSPLRRLFDYVVPQKDGGGRADVGCRVAVTFGRQEVVGLIVAITNLSLIHI